MEIANFWIEKMLRVDAGHHIGNQLRFILLQETLDGAVTTAGARLPC